MVRLHLLPPPVSFFTLGGITQLVEWLLCKQHVAGSNPTTSTKLRFRLLGAVRWGFVAFGLILNDFFSCLRLNFFDKLPTIEKRKS